MKTKRMRVATATIVGALALGSAPAKAQGNQQALAAEILSGNVEGRHRAVQRVRALGPTHVGPDLRAALFAALEREGRIEARRYEIDSRGGTLEDHPDPEFASRLTELVVELKDPSAIPALAASLATGSTAGIWALADFGEQAAPAVLDVAISSDSHPRQIDWALIVLRTMVEEQRMRPLSERTLEQIGMVAKHYLMERHSGAGLTLRRAIDLAVVMDDSELRKVVEQLASDPAAVRARGLSDPDVIERIRERAEDGLAGVPPRPRRP